MTEHGRKIPDGAVMIMQDELDDLKAENDRMREAREVHLDKMDDIEARRKIGDYARSAIDDLLAEPNEAQND